MMLCHQLLARVARRPRPGHRIANFNDRSPRYRAMKAHLRASAYKRKRETEPGLSVTQADAIPSNRVLPLLHLRRRYDEQARQNFIRDAILIGVIVATSAWALIHAVQTMLGS